MKVIFSEGAAEVFDELPRNVQVRASQVIELAAIFPRMFPFREKGVMAGHRCFTVAMHRFFYRASSEELQIVAIVPAMMKRA